MEIFGQKRQLIEQKEQLLLKQAQKFYQGVRNTDAGEGSKHENRTFFVEVCDSQQGRRNGESLFLKGSLYTKDTNHNTALVYGEIINYPTCTQNCGLKIGIFPGTLHSNYIDGNLMNKLPYLKNGKAKENVWGNQGDSFHKSPTKFAVNDIDLDQNKSQLVYIVAYGCSKCMQNGKVLKNRLC